MDSSSTSKQPHMLESKEGKLQQRRERARRASEMATERKQRLRKRRERDQGKREAESEEQMDFHFEKIIKAKHQGLVANLINFTLCFKANNIAIALTKAHPTDFQTSSLAIYILCMYVRHLCMPPNLRTFAVY